MFGESKAQIVSAHVMSSSAVTEFLQAMELSTHPSLVRENKNKEVGASLDSEFCSKIAHYIR